MEGLLWYRWNSIFEHSLSVCTGGWLIRLLPVAKSSAPRLLLAGRPGGTVANIPHRHAVSIHLQELPRSADGFFGE